MGVAGSEWRMTIVTAAIVYGFTIMLVTIHDWAVAFAGSVPVLLLVAGRLPFTPTSGVNTLTLTGEMAYSNDGEGLHRHVDPADDKAASVLEEAFPDRRVVQVPCRSLIWQNGSLHCITMQLPEGILA